VIPWHICGTGSAMPIPKSPDPKVSLSLRLRASVLEALKAKGGGDWRGEVEQAVDAWLAPPAPKPPARKAVDPAPKESVSLASVPIGPQPFKPRLKGTK
jgi:hypothetical protein